MEHAGYPTIPGKTFFSDSWARIIDPRRNIHTAWRYAKSRGLPVIVKPNSGTWGIGVALAHTKREFYRAMRVVFAEDRVGIVQKYVQGKDYRIVVLDRSVISAYERKPLSVVGDGHSSIKALLLKKQRTFNKVQRDTSIEMRDPRMNEKLKRAGLRWSSRLPLGVRVFLLDNANLSAGGDSMDVTKKIHPEFKKIAVAITKEMGLRLCGVDLMIEGDISKKPERYWVLEINSAPGLDHYAKTGKKQQKIVENLYLRVLKSMDH
jgi:D-alanine-D-alanine ligase-like ATP-grasp enzyme